MAEECTSTSIRLEQTRYRIPNSDPAGFLLDFMSNAIEDKLISHSELVIRLSRL